ncbi:MAG: DUF4279 domain-containing protein [Planctomycetota bacterium]
MSAPDPLPQSPLAHLRASRSDFGRALIARLPDWASARPVAQHAADGRGVTVHRLAPESFAVQVRWRWNGAQWDEGESDVLPGSVVDLRLVLDDVPPDAVTRALGLPPTRAFAKGDAGSGAGAARREGLWIRESMPGACCFPEEKVVELLATLRACDGWRDVVGRAGVRWAGIAIKLRAPIERPFALALDAKVLEDLVALSLALDVAATAE